VERECPLPGVGGGQAVTGGMMNKNSLLKIVALAMVLGLTACEQHSVTTSPLLTPVSPLPTSTPLPFPTWTPTATCTSRPTPPVPTSTFMPTPWPAVTLCPTPTPGEPIARIIFSGCGEHEMFSSEPLCTHTSLYLINSDGSGMRRIYEGIGTIGDLQLSPDGTRLAFSDSHYVDIGEQRYSSGRGYVLDLTTGQAWPVTPDSTSQHAWGLRWVSNELLVYAGRRIEAADSSSNVYLTDVHGEEWHPQLTDRQVGRTSILGIAVSPDRTQLVFVEFVLDSETTTVYRMNIDGTGLRELVTFPAGSHIVNVAWSPAGDQLVLYPVPMGLAEYAPVYTARADGSEIREVATLPGGHVLDLVGWTEDQAEMIFYACSRTLQANQIVEVHSDGNTHVLATIMIPGIPASVVPCSVGALSLDQQHFAFSPFYSFLGNGNLYLLDMSSGCCYQILSGYSVHSILWLPESASLQEHQ